MNADLEAGIKAYYATLFDAADKTFSSGNNKTETVTGFDIGIADDDDDHKQTVSLHCDTSKDVLNPVWPWVIVGVREDPKRVVGPLYDVDPLEILISVPLKVNGIDVDFYRRLVSAIRAPWEDDSNEDDVTTALTPVGFSTGGWFLYGDHSSIGETRWQTRIRVKLGVKQL